jgi:hypothetical protein
MYSGTFFGGWRRDEDGEHDFTDAKDADAPVTKA